MRKTGKEPLPCFLYPNEIFVHGPQGPGSPKIRSGRDVPGRLKTALNSTTNPLTATALIYAFGAGITAGAGTRLVLQLFLDV